MGKDRKKDKKDKKSKKDKKDKKERKKERREHKKEEEEEDEWVVAPLADAVAPLPPTEEPTDDFLLRTPPRSSNDDAAPDEDALPTHNAPSQREDAGLSWMLRPPPRTAPRPVPERPASPPPEETKPKPRELNPYFADGGSGLPSDDRRKRAAYTVGDGGNSWRARAERRARERALEEGTSPDAPAPTVDFEAVSRRDPYSGGSGRSDRGRGGGWRKRTDGNGGGAEDERDSRRDHNDDDGHRYRRRDDEREQRPREDRERGRTDERGGRGSRREEDEGHAFLSRKRELPPARDEESARHPREDRMDEVADAGSMPPPPAPAVSAAPVPQVSEEEANKLQAQLLKAELMGDQDRIRELKSKLAQIREAQKVVVLSGLDQRGRPINRPAGDNLDEARRMMAAERECDTRSANLDFARSLARHQAYSDEDFGEVHFDQTRSKKRRRTGAPERTAEDMQRAHAIAGEAQDQRMRENCTYCLDEGKRVGKHLLISMGQKAYLCLPHRGSLVPGHCFIVPHGHVGACTALETDVFQEIVEFQRALVRMFAQQDKVVLFFETGAVGKRTKHMVLQCVPMDKRDAAVAPGYFKKTLSDAGSEWGQHRKIIDTTGRGVRRAIPKEFPYFHVQFPDGTSFGHVIEDVKDFPKDLGKEVIAGVLELDPESVRGAHENFDAQRSRAQAFQRTWRPFDPTRAPQHPAGHTSGSTAGPAAASSGGPP